MTEIPYVQANTNGRLHDAREPSLSPLDRSFLYGDSVYEVVRTYDGVIFAFQEHFRRLTNSARAIGLELPFEESVLLTEIRRTVSAFFEHETVDPRPELYLRWQISRGGGRIGLDPQLADGASFVILAQALPEAPKKKSPGCRLTISRQIIRNHPRAINPAWKTGNYLNNLMALREARKNAYDDVLLVNVEGCLTEASTSNLFFVKDSRIVTPPLADGILPGITRGIILEQARMAWDIEIAEESIAPNTIDQYDECFLTSTTKGILPVGKINDVKYQVGAKTLTSRLQKTFQQYVGQATRKNAKHALF